MPDPFKNVKIIELMELFDDDEVTTADQIDRPQKALDREMFQNAFREEKAGGGMLVEPGFGGTRQGYRSAKAQKSKEKSAVKFDKFRVKIPTGEFVGEGRDKSEIFKIKNTKSGSVRYTVTGACGKV